MIHHDRVVKGPCSHSCCGLPNESLRRVFLEGNFSTKKRTEFAAQAIPNHQNLVKIKFRQRGKKMVLHRILATRSTSVVEGVLTQVRTVLGEGKTIYLYLPLSADGPQALKNLLDVAKPDGLPDGLLVPSEGSFEGAYRDAITKGSLALQPLGFGTEKEVLSLSGPGQKISSGEFQPRVIFQEPFDLSVVMSPIGSLPKIVIGPQPILDQIDLEKWDDAGHARPKLVPVSVAGRTTALWLISEKIPESAETALAQVLQEHGVSKEEVGTCILQKNVEALPTPPKVLLKGVESHKTKYYVVAEPVFPPTALKTRESFRFDSPVTVTEKGDLAVVPFL